MHVSINVAIVFTFTNPPLLSFSFCSIRMVWLGTIYCLSLSLFKTSFCQCAMSVCCCLHWLHLQFQMSLQKSESKDETSSASEERLLALNEQIKTVQNEKTTLQTRLTKSNDENLKLLDKIKVRTKWRNMFRSCFTNGFYVNYPFFSISLAFSFIFACICMYVFKNKHICV